MAGRMNLDFWKGVPTPTSARGEHLKCTWTEEWCLRQKLSPPPPPTLALKPLVEKESPVFLSLFFVEIPGLLLV